MNKFAAALGLGLLGFVAGCSEDGTGKSDYTGPLFRWHHAGAAALARATNATTLRQIAALPATAELRAQMATNLARALPRIWQKDLPADAASPTALLQPLLHDLLTAEAFIEIRGPVGRAETVLAIELDEARAKLWSTNLWQLAALWKLGTPQTSAAGGFAGWELKKAAAPNSFQFFRAGQWVVLGLGQDKLTLLPPLLQQAKQTQRPVAAMNGSLLEAQADLPGLRPWIPLLADFPLPPAYLTMAGRGENVRTELKLHYAGKVPWTYEPWKIPTNLVSEPLGSFTVARGVAPLLERVKGLKELGLKPLPNQFCAWSVTNVMCRLYFTVPVNGATNAMRLLAPTVPMYAYDRFETPLGNFLYQSNRAEIDWAGIPWIQPFLKAARGTASDFLLGGVFFLPPRNYPAPPELYAQLGNRTNLLYYDWELTDHRINHSRQLYELAALITGRLPSFGDTPSKKWIAAAGPSLRDSATEITQTGPQDLLLVRKSSIGLTGFELATLSTWLDSPGFPIKMDMPPRIVTPRTNPPPGAATPSRAPGNAAGRKP